MIRSAARSFPLRVPPVPPVTAAGPALASSPAVSARRATLESYEHATHEHFLPRTGLAVDRLPQLRTLLAIHRGERPLRILETHNGLTGLIAEHASGRNVYGDTVEFDGMWSSSLTASASQGKPDIEQVDTTNRLSLVRETLDVTSKPLIYDADTGGHPQIFSFTVRRRRRRRRRRLHRPHRRPLPQVRSLEQMGASACIIEDKTGLKQNSLFGTSRKQELDDIDAFCTKIRAGQEAKREEDFMVIARLEALIAGHGQDECLKRALAYVVVVRLCRVVPPRPHPPPHS